MCNSYMTTTQVCMLYSFDHGCPGDNIRLFCNITGLELSNVSLPCVHMFDWECSFECLGGHTAFALQML